MASSTTYRVLLAACLSMPALASAASAWHPANNEAGFTYHPTHEQPGKSRADVQAEIEAARKDGTLALYQRTAPIPIRDNSKPRTRAEVVDGLKSETAAQRQARLDALRGL